MRHMSEPNQACCRVGICDDVEMFRSVLARMFETESDIEVVGQACNGAQAIELVTSTLVDVLLLDVAMPVMDGLEALPQIRDAAPDTRVIMLTAFGTTAIRERALSEGAYRFVEKGTSPVDLMKVVRDACPC